MFDRIPSTKVVRKPAEVAVDYNSWRVVRFVLEHDGTVRYQLRLADANGNLAPTGFQNQDSGKLKISEHYCLRTHDLIQQPKCYSPH